MPPIGASPGRPTPWPLPPRTLVEVSSGSGFWLESLDTEEEVLLENYDFVFTGDRELETDESCCGVYVNGPVASVTVKNCSFSGFRQGIVLIGDSGEAGLLHVVDSEVYDTLAQGILADAVGKVKIRRNILAKCGEATADNHCILVKANCGPDVIVADCALIEPGSHGAKLLSGGTLHRNLAARCSTAFQIGGGAVLPSFGGVFGSVYDNVAAEGDNVGGGVNAGVGVKLANVNACQLINNLFWQNAGTSPVSLWLNGAGEGAAGVGVKNVTGHDNRCLNWKWGYKPDGTVTAYSSTDWGPNSSRADAFDALALDTALGANWIDNLLARKTTVLQLIGKLLVLEASA